MDVQLPNGYVITGIPEGTSKEEVKRKAIIKGLATESDFTQSISEPVDIAESGFEAGVMDVLSGGAQMLERALPESARRTVNEFNEWLRSKGIPLAEIPPGGLSQSIQEAEQLYQQERAKRGETGIDWGRIGGNIAGAAPLAPLFAGAPLTGGAFFGALQPVTKETDDFWREKAYQTGLGAVTGKIGDELLKGAASVIAPKGKDVQRLVEEGVQPTPLSVFGETAKRTEDKLMSLPILGDAIMSARTRGLDQFNRAAINNSLRQINTKLPGDVELGGEALGFTRNAFYKQYDKILGKMAAQADKDFIKDVKSVLDSPEVLALPNKENIALKKFLQQNIVKQFQQRQIVEGKDLKLIERQLDNAITKFSNSKDAYQNQVGDSLRDVRSGFNEMLKRQNPKYAEQLSQTDRGYAAFKTIQTASVASKSEKFSPSQLLNAIRQQDRTKGKRAFSEGEAMMQDLALSARNILSSQYPESGTAGRAAIGLGVAGGSAAFEPSILGGLVGGALPYTQPGMRALTPLLTSRPGPVFPLLGAGIQQAAPFAVPATSQAGYQALQ